MPKTRYSKQRELIYENLKARCDHPTAEAIYSDLKKITRLKFRNCLS